MHDTLASSPPNERYAARRYARLDIGRSMRDDDAAASTPPTARAPMPAAVGGPATDVLLDLDFARLVGYLRQRAHWIVVAVILGAAAAIAVNFVVPARYTASTEVLIDPSGLQVVSNDVYTSSDQRDAMVLNVESKMRILTSGQVFQRVVDQLQLASDPEFTSYKTLPPAESAVKALQDRIKVARDENSFVVTLSATTDNAEKSVRLASAVVQAFQQDLSESEAQGAGRAADALNQRLGALKSDVTQAEAAVEDFRRTHGLQTSQGELTSTQTMGQLNSQLVVAQAKLIDLKARYDKLTSGSTDSSMSAAAQESTTISALRTQYAATREQAQALKATLGPKHPNVIAINAQVATLQGQIEAETARIVQAAKTDVAQAQAAVDQLQSQVDQSKTAVATDDSAQVTLRDLQREADSRAAVYQAYLDRAKEITERQQIDTTNIRVISDPTVPPTRSFPPPIVQLVALGGAAGLALGAFAALVAGLAGWPRRPIRLPEKAGAGTVPAAKGAH